MTALAWDANRPSLGMTAGDRSAAKAAADRAIAGHHRALEAIRLLEGIAAGPKVHRPLSMARALRQLADEFEVAA